MAMAKHEHRQSEERTGLLDRLFDSPLRPLMLWPDTRDEVHVEEFRRNGTLVVRAELAGIEPDKDVQVCVHGRTLHIEAERKEATSDEARNYLRREIRYGSFVRELPLPEGVTAKDVKATYKSGILEVTVPVAEEIEPQKVPVTTS